MEFEWDEAKAAGNLAKHGVTFEEAQHLFIADRPYLEIHDDTHSSDEERFIAIGAIRRGVVVVIWTERQEETIRIISARWATKKETAAYTRYMDLLT